MKCQRCDADKKTDKGPFCQSCAAYFRLIKRGQHVWKFVHRPAERRLNNRRPPKVTLPPVKWESCV
jgi:hypothetical protein